MMSESGRPRGASLKLFGMLVLSLLGALPACATTFYFTGTFGTSYGGPLNGGTFQGWYNATLPLVGDTGTSYEYLSSYDVLLMKGSTLIEFKPGLNGSSGIYSAVYETVTGGDYLDFTDSSNDNLILYFAKGFAGYGPVVKVTPKGYVSDGGVGGYANSNLSNVASGIAHATPEPGTFSLLLGALLVVFGLRGNRLFEWGRRLARCLSEDVAPGVLTHRESAKGVTIMRELVSNVTRVRTLFCNDAAQGVARGDRSRARRADADCVWATEGSGWAADRR